MKTQTIGLVLAGLFLLFILAPVLTKAEIGEIAGQPNFNVSLGGNETLNVTLSNSGDAPIGFSVVMPVLNIIPNTTAPIITVNPMNGIIPPRSYYKVAITTYVPSDKNKPGQTWTGIMQFLQVSNVSNSGGAVFQVGVAKIITITATAQIIAATAAKSKFPDAYTLVAMLAVGCVGIGVYCIVSKLRAKRVKPKAAKRG